MANTKQPKKGKVNAGKGFSRARVTRSRKARGNTIKRVLFTLLVIAAIFVAVSFLVFRSENGASIFENAVGTVLRPVQSGLSSAAGWVKGFFTNWRNYGELEDEYEYLQMENEELKLRVSYVEELEQENARLSALMDAKADYNSLDPVYATVIARDPGQWFDTFTINRGTADGVTAGMCVVTGDGLVGYVFEAKLNSSKVMTIIDTRSAVACLVQRTRDNGIMRGEVTSDSASAECYVYYLPNVNNISPGDVIVTSGTDALYPKGIVIGEVTAVSQETSSDGSYVIVTPYVDFRHIEDVLVLRTIAQTDDELTSVPTPTPVPYMTAKPTIAPVNSDGTTVEPEVSDGNWYPPTAEPTQAPETPEPTQYELLPEDDWADS